MKKYTFLLMLLAFILISQNIVKSQVVDGIKIAAETTAKNKQLDAKVETKRIPKGSRLKVKLLDPVGTKNSLVGDMFNSMLIVDEKVDNSMVLPEGTIIRGYVQDIKPAKLASIGAVLYLKFDHIVTPSGSQLPVKSALSNYAKITLDGGIREQAGYGEALQENLSTSKNIVINATQWGWTKENPVAKYTLAPVGAIGGTLGAGFYLIGDSFIDLFRKGKQVVLNQGDVVEIIITKDLDVPVI